MAWFDIAAVADAGASETCPVDKNVTRFAVMSCVSIANDLLHWGASTAARNHQGSARTAGQELWLTAMVTDKSGSSFGHDVRNHSCSAPV